MHPFPFSLESLVVGLALVVALLVPWAAWVTRRLLGAAPPAVVVPPRVTFPTEGVPSLAVLLAQCEPTLPDSGNR